MDEPERPSSPKLAGPLAAFVGLVCLAGLGAWFLSRPQTAPPDDVACAARTGTAWEELNAFAQSYGASLA